MIQRISSFISLSEACKSATAIRYGISNVPDEDAIERMRLLCFSIYDPLCTFFGKPIPVTSFFRNKILNKKIGGSLSSQHCKGEAIDIDCDPLFDSKITNEIVFFHIMNNLKFDQLIWEFGTNKKPDWIHVSYSAGKNRNQVLVAKKNSEKKTIYLPF